MKYILVFHPFRVVFSGPNPLPADLSLNRAGFTLRFVTPIAPIDPLYTDEDVDLIPDLVIGRLPVRTQAELATPLAKTEAYEAKDFDRPAVFSADADRGLAQELFARLQPGVSIDDAVSDERPRSTQGHAHGSGLKAYARSKPAPAGVVCTLHASRLCRAHRPVQGYF